MKLLFDTHSFIWWASDPKKLSKKTLNACEDDENQLILSVVSVWEMTIKMQLGKLTLKSNLKKLISDQQETNNIEILPIYLTHVSALDSLPLHHRDPFDRLLIAQAMEEDADLISKDKIFSNYPVKLYW